MKPKKYPVRLSKEERKELKGITSGGKHLAETIKRANILLNLDENMGKVDTQEAIAGRLSTSTTTIYKVSREYTESGLAATLDRKQRETPARQPIATGDVEARIIALACSEPPEGRTRWTLRLLEEKVVELGIVDAISDNTIGRLLKKRRSSPT